MKEQKDECPLDDSPPSSYSSTTLQRTTADCCQYMTLLPRGLHFAAYERVQKKNIPLDQSIWVGEPEPSPYSHADLMHQNTCFSRDSVAFPIGTIHAHSSRKADISIGYSAQQKLIWTKGGQHSYIWWQFTARSTPPAQMASLRALGPITALVGSWTLPVVTTTLSEMTQAIQGCLQTDVYRTKQFPSALRIWRQVALSNWNKYNGVSQRIRDYCFERNDLFAAESSPGLKFRISCLRPDDPSYTYSRRDLIMAVAHDLVPSTWTVDLKHYDVEIVLFLRGGNDGERNSFFFTIGFALHPYQYIGCHTFSSGIPPPDVAPPYVSPTGIVRLRPSTAQLLLHVADLTPGAVVLDPCVGIGTIAHECAHSKYVGLGGDIVLTPELLAPQAISYSHAIRNEKKQLDATLMAWDAAKLPIRTGVVDAVVSDLPFGRLCLSSSKLQQLLPLMVNEMARVLQPCSGKMVLLCGHYKLVMETLEVINHKHGDTENVIWRFPCSAVFPVNIGGMLAWVVQIQRGPGIWKPKTFASEKVRKLTAMREIARLHPSAKKKKLQR